MAGPTFRTEFRGLKDLVKGLERREKKIVQAARGALFVEGEETMTEAKRLVPVDEGILKSSGHVRIPVVDSRGRIVVELGFGGPAGSGNQGETNDEDVGYAVVVHEDMEAHHTVGQAKYLEVPFKRRRRTFGRRFARRVKRRLGVV